MIGWWALATVTDQEKENKSNTYICNVCVYVCLIVYISLIYKLYYNILSSYINILSYTRNFYK